MSRQSQPARQARCRRRTAMAPPWPAVGIRGVVPGAELLRKMEWTKSSAKEPVLVVPPRMEPPLPNELRLVRVKPFRSVTPTMPTFRAEDATLHALMSRKAGPSAPDESMTQGVGSTLEGTASQSAGAKPPQLSETVTLSQLYAGGCGGGRETETGPMPICTVWLRKSVLQDGRCSRISQMRANVGRRSSAPKAQLDVDNAIDCTGGGKRRNKLAGGGNAGLGEEQRTRLRCNGSWCQDYAGQQHASQR